MTSFKRQKGDAYTKINSVTNNEGKCKTSGHVVFCGSLLILISLADLNCRVRTSLDI